MQPGTLRCVIERCVIDVKGEEISVHCIKKGKGRGERRKKRNPNRAVWHLSKKSVHFFYPHFLTTRENWVVFSSVRFVPPAATNRLIQEPAERSVAKRSSALSAVPAPAPGSTPAAPLLLTACFHAGARPRLPAAPLTLALRPALLHPCASRVSQFKGKPRRKINKSLLVMKY